jgi:hypothetical protein
MSKEPEVLDTDARGLASDEAALERRGAVDLLTIPRLIGGALEDIRRIAEGMAVLPKLLVSLDGIQTKVDSLDDEVKKMRAAVESMGGDVGEMQGSLERVEPHLEEVSKVVHPLRRINDRRGRGRDALK